MTRQINTDDHSFEVIYRSYGKEVYKLLFRLSGSQHDTEDLLQDTFTAIMVKLPTFKGESSLKTWIYAIAINKFRDNHRSSKVRRTEVLAGDEKSSANNPHDDAVAQETRERVKKAFYSLPEQQRTAFALVRFEGMAYKEAAQVMGTTLDTIRMRVHRAHQQLAEQLKDT
jgi:RNA polymerase sigma-70 factor (ECF subfamily)